jgi:hypothetical protein
MTNEANELDINRSLILKGFANITPDLLEAGVDQFFKDGLLKDIPILGTILKVAESAQTIIAAANRKKLYRFLFELKDISEKELTVFIKKLDNIHEYKDVGQTITLVLCRLDETKKATIIGKLYKAAIMGKIRLNDFLRLVYMVEKAFLDDLIKLSKNPHIEDPSVILPLYQVGLFDQVIEDGSPTGIGPRNKAVKLKFKINIFGEQLIKFGF